MINEHGVHINPIDFFWATTGNRQVILSVGEYGGFWGYGCHVLEKNSGFFVPCMPLIQRHISRNQAETAARLRANVPIETQLKLWPDTAI